jgi:hypothetical protein
VILRSQHTDNEEVCWPPLSVGMNRLRCTIPDGWLNTGRYSVAPHASIHNVRWIVTPEPVLSFDIEMTHGVSPYWAPFSRQQRRVGVVTPRLSWMRIRDAE